MIYKSCHLLEHGIYFYYDSIQVCCMLTGKEGKPFYLLKDYHGGDVDWDSIIEQKRKLRSNHKNGIINANCDGCFYLRDEDWEEGDYIDNFFISHWTSCNCGCSYCYTEDNKEFFNSHKPYKLMPILLEMKDRGLFRFNGLLDFGGGEPAVLDEFGDIVDLFLNNGVRNIVTNSSGIKYVESIGRGLTTGKLDVTVSIDSSSREMYKKIKKVDAYDKVVENLKKYVKFQGGLTNKVRSKYIIIPGINDQFDEIDSWLKTSLDIGIKDVIIDVEGRWYLSIRDNLPFYMKELILKIKTRADQLGLNLLFYSYANQIVHETSIIK